jgi:5-methylthioribose kinase
VVPSRNILVNISHALDHFYFEEVHISHESLVFLAARTAFPDTKPLQNGRVLTCHVGETGQGGLNYIIELSNGSKSVVRKPANGWGGRFAEVDKEYLRSSIFTVQLIRNQTNVPVPEIYSYSTGMDNIIGAPHIVMSFISRHTVQLM